MQIVLVRHGQSTNNAMYEASEKAARAAARGGGEPGAEEADAKWTYPGRRPDPPLTDLGVRQAEALGAALRDGRAPFEPTHLYASLTTRAVQTARPLAEATGLPVTLRPDAHEVGGIHCFDGTTRTRHARPGASLRALQACCPGAVPEPGVFADADTPWHGGLEPDDDLALPRAHGLVAALRARHDADDVVTVVTHQYFSQFVLAALLQFDGPPWQRFRVDNTAHVAILLDGGRVSVEWMNRSEHLAPEDVTN